MSITNFQQRRFRTACAFAAISCVIEIGCGSPQNPVYEKGAVVDIPAGIDVYYHREDVGGAGPPGTWADRVAAKRIEVVAGPTRVEILESDPESPKIRVLQGSRSGAVGWARILELRSQGSGRMPADGAGPPPGGDPERTARP